MGVEKICIVLFTLLVFLSPRTMSSKDDENKTCKPSHCGIITNISYPFRLQNDPPNCGLHPYEIACENNVPFLHLHPGNTNSKYQLLGINYENYTIRLRDPGIQEGNCSSLPNHFISRSNFSDTYNFSVMINNEYDSNNPYVASPGSTPDKKITFDHVIYLECRNPVMDDEGYVDTASCVTWVSKGEGGGHVYAVIGDLEAERLKKECSVKSVVAIDSDWSSLLDGDRRSYSYDEIHGVISYGFKLTWWPLACTHHHCAVSEGPCIFDNREQKLGCSKATSFCYSWTGHGSLSLFCGKAAHLSYGVKAFLLGILAGMTYPKDVHEFALLEDTEYEYITFNEVGDLNSTRDAFTLGKITAYVSTAIIILRFLVGILLLFVLMIHTYRRRYLSVYESIEDFIRLHHDLHPIRYSYRDLKTMTKGFKNKIGEGGFGTVYKGKLRSGTEVAVKMLGSKSKATSQDFINEVATIGRIHHFNVVRLIGFCVEGTKRALIYEFMSNGSLDKHIFLKEGIISLSYRKIYDISLGIARGIAYLHHGCDMQILHFDIKPSNIILDDNLTPKISDFGLARLYYTNDSIATLTAARGTIGYMAPELLYKNVGKVSHKTDVYSFGKLLMEMASRRRNTNPHVEHSSQVYFPSWIYNQFDEEKDIEMDGLTEEEKALAKKMFIVALWCIQFNPGDRLSMNKVIEMLEVDDVESLDMPPKPSIYPENDQPNFDETTSSFSISSNGNLGEDASNKK